MKLPLLKYIHCGLKNVCDQISMCIKERDIVQFIAWIVYGYFWLAMIITLLLLGVFNLDFPLIPMGLAELAVWAFDSGTLTKIFGLSVLRIQGVLFGLYFWTQMYLPCRGKLIFHVYGIVYSMLDCAALIAMYTLTVPVHYAAYPWGQVFSNLLFLVFNILKIVLVTRKRKS